ncbi:ABC transporter ATP-binding protein [Bacillus pseudomycoides]|uniref:ABC transporter ATP-binding protein n=2 Tax=Bacillus TaxID=1386 RepID=UPI0018F7C30D|nr:MULTISPECIES: ABC transporter ATP-binding protein [Bacillus cereus group]MBJ8031168.1 ABC transporter ATP-binding protein [Bacillus cereus group sp. N21]MCX2829653.1 ABC transporter ATP-binding protein [Bacillus sp. DHT2]MDR4919094.1 ABC transporter ATP-binding protein [Bacillus pseudomycoides]
MHNMIKEDEQLNISQVFRSFKFLPRVFHLLWKTHPAFFILVLFINGLQGFIPAAMLLATQKLINTVALSQNESNFEPITIAILILVGIGLFNEILSTIEDYINTVFESMLVIRINENLMNKSTSLSLSQFEDSEVQNLLKRAQSEASYRPYQILGGITTLYSGCITLVSTVIIVFTWNAWVASVLIFTPVIFFYWFLRLAQLEFKVHYDRAHRERESWYLSFLTTKDTTFKEIKLFQLGKHLISRYQKINKYFLNQDKELARRRLRLSFVFQLINQLLMGCIIFLIALSAFTKQILIGNVVGLIQACTNTLSASQGIVRAILSFCQNNLYLQQLFTFLDLPEEQKKQSNLANIPTAFNEKINTIDICNLTFTYPNTDKRALRNINISLKKGETVAIIGKNGSGKSTLVKCLLQLYTNYSGEILVNGRKLTEIEPLDYTSKIGAVFQDFVHFELSARDNIGFGDTKFLQDDISLYNAAENAGISSLVKQLPKQLDTQLGKWFDDGYQLSGGQWQRIAIARAFVRDADIYILDEPSAALDPEAEKDVFNRFKQLVEDRIGIFISHRYSSVRYADKIIVMEDGEIKEFGNHDSLIKECGIYAELYNMQAEAFLSNNVELQTN